MSLTTAPQERTVILLDVDNTLLDNDALKADLASRLTALLGPERADRFWQVYEEVRREEGYVDYPSTIRRFASETAVAGLRDQLEPMLYDYPFRDRLYPHVFDTLEHLNTAWLPVILSDGDPVYQPLKIQRSGLAGAVDGRVMIAVHKEEELERVFATYPADHYVMVDDKPRIHAALERSCPSQFTTILVMQGKYAGEQATPSPDVTVQAIGDLREFGDSEFRADLPRQAM